MEIIAELEGARRGVYTGAIGYVGYDGAMDTSIAIRTAVVRDGVAHVQVGCGIVADSEPAAEWRESLAKGRGLLAAVEAGWSC
jgi:anthranilate synthase component I